MKIRTNILILATLPCIVLPAPSQTNYTVLRLLGPAPDGTSVIGRPTLGSDGLLYGVTFQGGSTNVSDGWGTVFRLTRDGRGYSILRRFTLSGGLPREPNGALVEAADGRLYGVLYQGGTANRGGVFGINRDGTGYVTLRNFLLTGNDGAGPVGQLCEGSDGALYGVTSSGGATLPLPLMGGIGTVFKINPNGTGYQVLHRFQFSASDGHSPFAGVIEAADGMLYGTTRQGGSDYAQFSIGSGTIYKLNKNGTGYSIVWNFAANSTGGKILQGGVLQASDRLLYGMAEAGGTANRGVVFKVGTDGTGFVVLHHFAGTGGDGANPNGPLIEGSDGALYGTTQSGGAGNLGTVFKINKDGSGYFVLKSFTALPGDGTQPPDGLIQDANGWLYGSTRSRAVVSGGSVFLLSPIPTASITPPAISAGAFTALGMVGSAYTSYRLQGATNLVNPLWTDVARSVTGVGGQVTFTNLPTVDPSLFYRIVTP